MNTLPNNHIEPIRRAMTAMASGMALCKLLEQSGYDETSTPDLVWSVGEVLSQSFDALDVVERAASSPAAEGQEGVRPVRSVDQRWLDRARPDMDGHAMTATQKKPAVAVDRFKALELLERAYLLVGPMALHGNLLFHGCLNWEDADTPQLDPKVLMAVGQHLLLAHEQLNEMLEQMAQLAGIEDMQGEFLFQAPMVKGGEA